MANNVAKKMDYGWLFSKLFTYKFQNSNNDQKEPKVKKCPI
jgi:hypothetical protein